MEPMQEPKQTIDSLTEEVNRLRAQVAVLKEAEAKRHTDASFARRLEQLLNRTSQEIYILDAATLRVCQANESACRNLGYTLDELMQMALPDFRPGFDRAGFLERSEPVRNSVREEIVLPGVQQRKDGSIYPVEVRLYYLDDEDLPVYVAFVQDITERTQTEQALRENEVRLRRIIESNMIGVSFADLTGRITDANEAFLTMLGYTKEDLEAGSIDWSKITPPEYLPLDARAVETLLERGVVEPYEKQFYRKDGSRIAVLLGATIYEENPGKGIAFILELSERKRAETGLRFLAEASEILSSSLDYVTQLKAVARLVVPHLADWCAIHIANEDGTARQIEVAHVDPAKVALVYEAQQRYPDNPNATTGVPQVLRTGRSEIMSRIPQELLEAAAQDEEHRRLIREVGFKSYMCVPMNARGRTLGTITFIAAESGRHYDEADLALAEDLARRAAIAIDNARLYQEVQDALIARDYALAQAEAERARLYDLFMNAPSYIATLQGPSHIIEFANSLMVRLFGNRELVGKRVQDAVPELVEQGLVQVLKQVHVTGQPFIGNEVSVKIGLDTTPEERIFNFVFQPLHDARTGATGVMIYATDVTEQVWARRQIEQMADDLARHAGELAAIIEAIPDGIFVWDATGGLIRVNTKGAQMLHLPTDLKRYTPEILQQYRSIRDFWYPDGTVVPAAEAPVYRALQGEVVQDMRLMSRHPETGEEIYLRVSAAPTRDHDGQITGVVSIASDITELYRLEKQKDQFLAVASHELKTPITSVKGFTQIAIQRLERAGHMREAESLRKADVQIDRLTELVGDLLDVSRAQTGRLEMRRERFDLVAMVLRICEMMQATTTRHTVEVHTPEHLEIEGDAERLEQVLTNLLSNAIKYSPAGGPIEVNLVTIANEAQICVSDSGIGIPVADREQLFQRFYRASNIGEHRISGFGIGLYISREIIHAHGGHIWLNDDTETGSRFCFALPLPANE